MAPRVAGSGETPAAVDLTATVASTSTPEGANPEVNPLDPVAPVQKKTRFAARADEHKEKKIATVSAKQREKAAATPDAMTAEEKASAQTQAAPLGLAGDTGPKKKAKKVKPPKGEKKVKQPKQPKTRLEDQKKEAPPAAPEIAPTASPALAPTQTTGTGRERSPAATPATQAPVPDSTAPPASTPGTTVPPTTPPAPGAPQVPPTE